MQTISIPYGRGVQRLHIEESRVRAVLTANHIAQREKTQEELVRAAMENPISSPRARDLAKGKKHILIITSDHTRPVPSRVTMPQYLAELRSGSPEAEIHILIATGMHRPTTEAELRAKLGDDIVEKETIIVHDAMKDEDMADFGILPSGGRLRLNKELCWADMVVSEGFIEPHFFAGFSGGRKSILPGIASRETVLWNHNAQFLQDSHTRQGILDGNPIHRDMLFAAKVAGLCFILNVLIDEKKEVIAAVSGDLEEAHRIGCNLSLEMTKVDAVVSDIAVTSNGGYPLDQNMYQSVKGMTAAEACVREGGIIIMCTELSDGHGGESFYHWFADRPDVASVNRDITSLTPAETHMDQWEAQILARELLKAEGYIVTTEKNRAMIEAMHMRWFPDVDSAMKAATEKLGKNASVTVIPDGVGVIPR